MEATTIVTGDRYLEKLVHFVERHAGALIDGSLVLKLNPAGFHYVHSRLDALTELESLLAGAPVDYLRAYVSDLGDHRALEQLRRILRLLTSLKLVSVLPGRDPTPLSFWPFGRLRALELRGCDLSTSAAKGLLELRHTLEKIVCHNSTDALRHVFASRIAEIKDSPVWNKLTFVSCACNGLVLMDESLQLLSAVETLDLSRNKFAKVDNLRKCGKLKHLDLGFNHLRTISSIIEVTSRLLKLVLRNNALTSLRGIENLKSLEGLDVSYNCISNFLELEFLGELSSLQSLWLEGNPLCCASWYRSQVFSYFSYPEKLKLDDKKISTREFWKRQLIIASRQKRPASFGFYSPAKCDDKEDASINRRRKKVSRLASIVSEEGSTSLCSDQESVCCDNEIQSREELVISDDEAEVVNLMTRVELMKKESSVLWLREFKEWLEHAPEESADSYRHSGKKLHVNRENAQASGDESTTNVFDTYSPFLDVSGPHGHHVDQIGYMGNAGFDIPVDMDKSLIDNSHDGTSSVPSQANRFDGHIFIGQKGRRMVKDLSMSLSSIDDISESLSSSVCPGSPPHYQKDILHRRHNLEEEILQLSAESFSAASSDSNTSCSEDDNCESGPSITEGHQLLNKSMQDYPSSDPFRLYDMRYEVPRVRESDRCSVEIGAEKNSNSDQSLQSHASVFPCPTHDDELLERRNRRQKIKKRVVTLVEDEIMVRQAETLPIITGSRENHMTKLKDEQESVSFYGVNVDEDIDKNLMVASTSDIPLSNGTTGSSGDCFSSGSDEFIEDYFMKSVADTGNNEICKQYMRCYCVLESDSLYSEREAAVLLSTENKVYVLLTGIGGDGSGTVLNLQGSHRVQDTREVVVGVGLQVVRVKFAGESATYLFKTRSIESSRQLLSTLTVIDHYSSTDTCLRSLEQVQVGLFEKQICGGSKLSILQYSIVQFWCSNVPDGSWLSRSIFLAGENLFVCVEDLIQFSHLSVDTSLPYFSLDLCCSIAEISELVVETRKSRCLTIAVECAMSEFSTPKAEKDDSSENSINTALGSMTWKLKWFSEESLFKFVALLKAIHAGLNPSPLLIRCIS